MVSKFTTVAKLAGILAGATFGLLLHAADPKTSNNTSFDFVGAKKVCDEMYAAGSEDRKNCYKRIESSMGVSGSGNCDEDYKEFNKAIEAFGSACSTSGLTSSNTNGLKCTEAIMTCESEEGVAESFDEEPSTPRGDDLDSESSTSVIPSLTPDMEDKYARCPHIAKEDLKEFKDDYEKAKEKVDELEEKKQTLQTELDQLKTTYDSKVQEIKTQVTEAKNEFNEEKANLKEDSNAKIAALQEEIAGYEAEIAKLEDDIRINRVAIQEVPVKFASAVQEIRLTCYKNALTQITARRMEIFKLQQAKQYNRGTMQQTFKSVGRSDRIEDQREIQKLKQFCERDPMTKKAIQDAERVRDAEKAQRESQEATLKVQIGEKKKAISKVKSGANCSGSVEPNPNSTDDKMCQALNDYQAKFKLAAEKATNKAQDFQSQLNNEMQKYALESRTKNEALASATRKYDEAQQEMAGLRDILAARMKAKGASNVEAKNNIELMSKYSDVNSKARNLKECCSDTGVFNKTGACKDAKRQMDAVDPTFWIDATKVVDDPGANEALQDAANEANGVSPKSNSLTHPVNSAAKSNKLVSPPVQKGTEGVSEGDSSSLKKK